MKLKHLFPIAPLALLAFLGMSSLARSQEAPPGLRFSSFTISSHARVQAGKHLSLVASVTNTSDQPLRGMLETHIVGAEDARVARYATFAPGKQAQVPLQIRVPSSMRNQSHLEIEMSLYGVDGGREYLLDRDGVPMRTSLRLPLDESAVVTATSLKREPNLIPYWYWPERSAYHEYEMVVANRLVTNNSRVTVGYDGLPIPMQMADWDTVDNLLLAAPQALHDAAAMESLKRFLNEGGRVWVMLDQVPVALVRPLFELGQTCEEVDVVEFNQFTIEVSDTNTIYSAEDRLVVADAPIPMKRVLQTGGQVAYRVEGWPAAIQFSVGHGELVLTTLAAAGWIEKNDEENADSPYRPRAWAVNFASQINQDRAGVHLDVVSDYPQELIGNPVLPRRWVGLGLMSFIGLLVLAGVVSLRSGDLSRLGVLAPCIAGLVGCSVLFASMWLRRDIPEMSAALRVIEVTPDGTTAQVVEQGVVYLNEEKSMNLNGTVDGYALADPSVSSGIKRQKVEGFESWSLSNETWPPGSWRYEANYFADSERLYAQAELTERGLELVLPEESPELEDVVVSYVPGMPMLGDWVDGRLLVDGSLAAGSGRWAVDTMISNEQLRRAKVYEEMFRGKEHPLVTPRSLCGWTSQSSSLSWEPGLEQSGASLINLPLRLLTPPVGASFLIPKGLIRLQHDSKVVGRTSAYQASSGTWAKNLSIGIQANLEFVLPKEVLPLEASELQFELDVKAPNRTVRVVSTPTGMLPIELVRLESPSVPWSAAITDPAVLEDARDGILSILLEVSERTDVSGAEAANTVVNWEIDTFRVGCRGTRKSLFKTGAE